MYSIVDYVSEQSRSKCGYCQGSNTSNTYGMNTRPLTVQHYQCLIDRGWRRCGCYCYKSIMKTTCCPLYTIKCEALDFKLSKSQKKVLKHMVKFLNNELSKEDKKTAPIKCDRDIVGAMEIPEFAKFAERLEQNASKMQVTSVSEELDSTLGCNSKTESSTSRNKRLSDDVECSQTQPMETAPKKKTSLNFDPSRAPQKKAKLLRIERKRNKLLSQGKTQEEINAIMNKKKKQQNNGKSLEDYFTEITSCSNKLEMRLVRTMSEEFLNTIDESANLFKKYQMTIHKDEPEECDKRVFFNFLVTSPLQKWTPTDGPPLGYGSFHEQYWLNGTLIAVAVTDILPSCMSSVYFFYDPEYSHLSLGTFSSLREVLLTQQLNKYAPNLKYYYMGYYIHSCPKMRYKARMRPSKLLCPETYVWCDIDKCLPKLDISKYSRLNEDPSATDEDGIVDITQVLMLYRNKAMRYGTMVKKYYNLIDIYKFVQEYASLVGKECALNMFYVC